MSEARAERNVVERLADVALYAPIGLVVEVARLVPDLAATGRARTEHRIATARMVGKMAVTMGSKEIKRRFWPEATAQEDSPQQAAAAGGTAAAAGAAVPAAPESTTPPATETAEAAASTALVDDGTPASGARVTELRPKATSASKPATGRRRGRGSDPDPAVPTADELPIAEYESLAASQVVARLADLPTNELDLVERFEQAHRRRRTVLGKIDQLRR